jgi:hypothetical protein
MFPWLPNEGARLLGASDGRRLQEVGTNQTLVTELIDLDHTTRTREFGTLGLGQTLKQLHDSGHKFPIYGNQGVGPGAFDQLGDLKFHHNRIVTSP